MDVVDLSLVFLQISVEEALQYADGKLALRRIQMQDAGLRSAVPADFKALLRTCLRLQRLEQRFRIAGSDHAMNRLKYLGVVMDVFQFHQGKARRVHGEIHAGILLFQLLVAGFRRGQRVVAITDGKDHGRSLQALILFPDILGVFGQPRIECLGFLPGNEPARDMTAALHEVEVVELPERLLVRGNRLDQNLFVVVAEHQNMRQLNGRIPADTHARRNPLDNCTLRRPNGGNGTGGIVVCVQIYHADQSFAH